MWPFPSKEEREREKREEETQSAYDRQVRSAINTLGGIRAYAEQRTVPKTTYDLWIIIGTLAREIEELKAEVRKK